MCSVFLCVRTHTCTCVLLHQKVGKLYCGPLPCLWSVPSWEISDKQALAFQLMQGQLSRAELCGCHLHTAALCLLSFQPRFHTSSHTASNTKCSPSSQDVTSPAQLEYQVCVLVRRVSCYFCLILNQFYERMGSQCSYLGCAKKSEASFRMATLKLWISIQESNVFDKFTNESLLPPQLHIQYLLLQLRKHHLRCITNLGPLYHILLTHICTDRYGLCPFAGEKFK